jgi:hypothetical protein
MVLYFVGVQLAHTLRVSSWIQEMNPLNLFVQHSHVAPKEKGLD